MLYVIWMRIGDFERNLPDVLRADGPRFRFPELGFRYLEQLGLDGLPGVELLLELVGVHLGHLPLPGLQRRLRDPVDLGARLGLSLGRRQHLQVRFRHPVDLRAGLGRHQPFLRLQCLLRYPIDPRAGLGLGLADPGGKNKAVGLPQTRKVGMVACFMCWVRF